MIRAILIVAAAQFVSLAQEPLFRDLSLDAAMSAAREENKLVMVDFWAPWCEPCRKLDTTTWADPKTAQWISAKFVAIKVDTARDDQNAKRFNVLNLPTVLFLNEAGQELDRIIGYCDPTEFVAEATDVLAGKSLLERAKSKMLANRSLPMAHHEYGNALLTKGQYEQALQEFNWCLSNGRRDASYSAVRRTFLLSDIQALGRYYPPALGDLRRLRDAAEESVLAGSDSADDIADIVAINNSFATPQRTLQLIDGLKSRGMTQRQKRRLLRETAEVLLQARRYSDVFFLVGDPEKYVDEAIRLIESASLPISREALRKSALNDGYVIYQALVGAEMRVPASAVAASLLKCAPGSDTYVGLIHSAVAAGDRETAEQIAALGLGNVPESQRQEIRNAIGEPKAK